MEENLVLVAKLDNVRWLAQLLKAIHFKDVACLSFTEHGMKATVEDAKAVQANAFLHAAVFEHYELNIPSDSAREEDDGQVAFRVNLTQLLECLNMFGSGGAGFGSAGHGGSVTGGGATVSASNALQMAYGGEGCPLRVMLQEEGVVIDCKLNTMSVSDEEAMGALDFAAEEVLSKVIMKAECLREIFAELDLTSEFLDVSLAPGSEPPPHIRLSTSGYSGTTHFDLARDSSAVESFQVGATRRTSRYRLSLIKAQIKALHQAAKVSLRTDRRGFLSLQYMVRLDSGECCFIEYYCAPEEDQMDAT